MKRLKKRARTNMERFMAFVTIAEATGCWQWSGSEHSNTLSFSVDGKRVNARRWIYMDQVGEIGDGVPLGRTCDNRLCVNPLHAEPRPYGTATARPLQTYEANRRKYQKRIAAWQNECDRCGVLLSGRSYQLCATCRDFGKQNIERSANLQYIRNRYETFRAQQDFAEKERRRRGVSA